MCIDLHFECVILHALKPSKTTAVFSSEFPSRVTVSRDGITSGQKPVARLAGMQKGALLMRLNYRLTGRVRVGPA